MIDDATFTFANLLTKAVAHNIPLKGGPLDLNLDSLAIYKFINANPESHVPFCELFLHYAINGTPEAAPQYDPKEKYLELSTAWRVALESFIVGHELGHAHLGHLEDAERRLIGHAGYSEVSRRAS
jgi:hypothetical protein